MDRRWRAEALWLVVPGVAILAVAAALLGRMPWGGPGALVSGLAAYWLGGRRTILTLPGLVFGVCIGASVRAHLLQGSAVSTAAMLAELVRDALPGGLIGLASLAPVFAALHLRARTARRSLEEASHGSGDLPGRRLQ